MRCGGCRDTRKHADILVQGGPYRRVVPTLGGRPRLRQRAHRHSTRQAGVHARRRLRLESPYWHYHPRIRHPPHRVHAGHLARPATHLLGVARPGYLRARPAGRRPERRRRRRQPAHCAHRALALRHPAAAWRPVAGGDGPGLRRRQPHDNHLDGARPALHPAHHGLVDGADLALLAQRRPAPALVLPRHDGAVGQSARRLHRGAAHPRRGRRGRVVVPPWPRPCQPAPPDGRAGRLIRRHSADPVGRRLGPACAGILAQSRHRPLYQ